MILLKETELDLDQFNAWSGAIQTKEIIIAHDKQSDFSFLIEDIYPNGLTEKKLNDILWFEDKWIYEQLGIKIDE